MKHAHTQNIEKIKIENNFPRLTKKPNKEIESKHPTSPSRLASKTLFKIHIKLPGEQGISLPQDKGEPTKSTLC